VTDPLKIQFPSQGWKQISSARKEILDAYDSARDKTKAHEVEIFHGKVLEAALRKWLAEFLPKRYGVTSGYVVSPGIPSSVKAPHFDVIIYDQLDSPVLWTEGNPDSSAQGHSRAIPVEYVRGVLEVKSNFSATTVKVAIEHLRDLSPVMSGLDKPDDPYKLHLPLRFFCAVVFGELRQEALRSDAALAAMIEGAQLRTFVGGLVLRAHGHTTPSSGLIHLVQSKTPMEGTVGRTPLNEFGLSDSEQVEDNLHFAATIRWQESAFARFSFDVLALMNGTYRPGRLSSFYGQGDSITEMMKEAGATVISHGGTENI
jgi:hypothetical protein